MKQLNDDIYSSNITNLYYQIFFQSIDLPSKLKIEIFFQKNITIFFNLRS